MTPTLYIQKAQEEVLRLIRAASAEDGIRTLQARFYAGEAGDELGLGQLQRETERGPVVLVSFSGRSHVPLGTAESAREETLVMTVFVAARNLRSSEDQERSVYPVIECIDRALLGEATLGLDGAEQQIVFKRIEQGDLSTVMSDTKICVMAMEIACVVDRLIIPVE